MHQYTTTQVYIQIHLKNLTSLPKQLAKRIIQDTERGLRQLAILFN